jgi:hypothetical protein
MHKEELRPRELQFDVFDGVTTCGLLPRRWRVSEAAKMNFTAGIDATTPLVKFARKTLRYQLGSDQRTGVIYGG